METPFNAYTGAEPSLFVSYAHKDAQTVYPAIEALHAKGFRIWYDEGIEAGSDWAESIGRNIERSAAVLLFLSKNSAASENCLREIAFAESHNIPIVTVSLGDVKLPGDLAKKLTVNQITNMADFRTYGALADALSPALARYGTRGEADPASPAYEDRPVTLADKKKATKALTAVLVVLAVLAALAGILFGVLFKAVPDVIGLSGEEAEQRVKDAGFSPTVSLNYSEEYAYGTVFEQSATGRAFKFIPVVLTESLGSREDLTDVPDTVGDHVSDGVSKMLTAGLSRFTLAEEKTNETEELHIASQSIPAGLRVSKNNNVSLGVATEEDQTVTFDRTVGTKAITYKVFVGKPVVVTVDDVTDEVVFEYDDATVTVDADGAVTVDSDLPGGGADGRILTTDEDGNDLTDLKNGGDGPDDGPNGDAETGDGTGNGNEPDGDTQTGNGDANQGNTGTGGNGDTNQGDTGNGGNGNDTQTGNGNDTQTGNGNDTQTGNGGTGNTEPNSALLSALGLDAMSDAELARVKAVTLIGTTNLSNQFDLYNAAATPAITSFYGNSIHEWSPSHAVIRYGFSLFNTDGTASATAGTLSDLSELAKLPNLEVLILHGQNISDITPILSLTNLRVLSLNCNPLSSIAGIGALSNLEYLSLTDTNVGDISPALSCSNLVSLGLDRTRVTSLAGTDRLPNLKNISFRLTGVSAMPYFANGSNVRITANQVNFTDLSGLVTVNSFDVLQIDNVLAADLFPYLTGKSIDRIFWAGDKGIATLGGFAAISPRDLDLCGANDLVSLDGCEQLTSVHQLNLKGCGNITDLTPLLNMPNLESLQLYRNQSDLATQLDGSSIEILYDD